MSSVRPQPATAEQSLVARAQRCELGVLQVLADADGDTPYVDGLDTFPDESDQSDGDTLGDRWDTGAVGDFTGLKLKDDHANRHTPLS